MIVALLVGFTCILNANIVDAEKRGQFGDQFGAMNALFSGLAFFGLILTIAFQARDLNLQRKDLRLQTEALRLQIQEFKEQKDEMKRSAHTQEDSNRLKLAEMKITLGKMRLNLDIESIRIIENKELKGERLNELRVKVSDLWHDLELINLHQSTSETVA